jgi:hypothetical protein
MDNLSFVKSVNKAAMIHTSQYFHHNPKVIGANEGICILFVSAIFFSVVKISLEQNQIVFTYYFILRPIIISLLVTSKY